MQVPFCEKSLPVYEADNGRGIPSLYSSEQKRRAAELVAHDELKDVAIALEVGISPRCLYKWKRDPGFREMVAGYTKEYHQGLRAVSQHRSTWRRDVSGQAREKVLQALRTLALHRGRIAERLLDAAPLLRSAAGGKIPEEVRDEFEQVGKLLDLLRIGAGAEKTQDLSRRIYTMCVPLIRGGVPRGWRPGWPSYLRQKLWEAVKSLTTGQGDLRERLFYASQSLGTPMERLESLPVIQTDWAWVDTLLRSKPTVELTSEECDQLASRIFNMVVKTGAWEP